MELHLTILMEMNVGQAILMRHVWPSGCKPAPALSRVVYATLPSVLSHRKFLVATAKPSISAVRHLVSFIKSLQLRTAIRQDITTEGLESLCGFYTDHVRHFVLHDKSSYCHLP